MAIRQKITWKDIQKELSKEDIAIEFIATIDKKTTDMEYHTYHALVIDKNCLYPQMITLFHDEGIENGTEHLKMLWKPLLEQYKGVKNIYFSPDGVMHGIPIENLSLDSIEILSHEYNMYRLSSTKELVKKNKKPEVENAVLYGGLTYSIGDAPDLAKAEGEHASILRGIEERGGFEPLYETLNEIDSIFTLLKQNDINTTLYIGESGTEESFRNLSSKGVNMIHLATHGMFVDNEVVSQKKNENNMGFLDFWDNEKDPVYENTLLTHSFLVMAGGNKMVQREKIMDQSNDGLLTAQEISEFDLSGTDLVVLSACETAKGEITMDGLLGLPWGFKKAGVKSLLMSLNKVDDEATRIFMVEFYRNLMSGKSKYQSLKDAQKYLRECDNGKYDNPKYWASFIMLDGLD